MQEQRRECLAGASAAVTLPHNTSHGRATVPDPQPRQIHQHFQGRDQ